jgi:hypothetical protein
METIQRLDQTELTRMKILRKAKYQCEVCKGINHKEGYYNNSGIFIHCDEHMRDWAVRQGIKLIRISLQVLSVNYESDVINKKIQAVLCRKHAMEIKNKIRERKKAQ